MNADIRIVFIDNDKGTPAGKLADVELHFGPGAGLLAGHKLVGFAVWERRNGGHNVTVPARQYSVNGERRSFALLRPLSDAGSADAMRDVIISAYTEWRAMGDDTPPPAAPVVVNVPPTMAPLSPAGFPEPQRYATPDEAARAARAGQPIVISDLIPRRAAPADTIHRHYTAPAPTPTPGQRILF